MAPFFAQQLGHPVIDKTGITGKYDFTLNWTPTQGTAGGSTSDASQSSAPGDASAPSLFTAVQEQLGLKLEAQKGPIETLVIDSAEKPSVDGAEVQTPAGPTRDGETVTNGAPANGGQKEVLRGAYKVWLNQDVRWVITDQEAQAFQQLMNDEERDKFIEQFWQRRNPNPNAVDNAYRNEIYARMAYANEHFATDQPGWMTDRGHVYIVYGKPDEVFAQPGVGADTWTYRHMPEVGDNIVLKFAPVAGSGRYRLVPPLPAGLFGQANPTRDDKTVTNGAPASMTAQMRLGAEHEYGILKDGRFHHFLTDVELTIPDGYVFAGCGPSSGNGEQAYMHSQSKPNVGVWMRPIVEPIDGLKAGLREKMIKKPSERGEGWKERPESAQERTFSGKPGESVVADYMLNGRPWVEYLIWIDTGKTHTQFYGQAEADQLALLRESVDTVATAAVIP
jgi:GWxTD domain-containing protein